MRKAKKICVLSQIRRKRLILLLLSLWKFPNNGIVMIIIWFFCFVYQPKAIDKKKSRKMLIFIVSENFASLSSPLNDIVQGSENFSDLICRHLDSFFYWHDESFSCLLLNDVFVVKVSRSNVNKFLFLIADFADEKFC